MPSVATTYASGQYLKADELAGGRDLVVTIKAVSGKELDGKSRLEVSFRESTKRLTLNKINACAIAEMYGDNTDQWAGKIITLRAQRVEFQGKLVNGIRVALDAAPPARAAQATVPKAAAPAAGLESIVDHIATVDQQQSNGRALYLISVSGGERFWTFEDPVARNAKARCSTGEAALLKYQQVRNQRTGVTSFKLVAVEDAPPPAEGGDAPAGPAADDIPF